MVPTKSEQVILSFRVALSSCPESLTIVEFIQEVLTVPLTEVVSGPLGALFRVTLVAGIWGAKFV